jgi:hypothetical protein
MLHCKKKSTFCFYPENFHEAEFKGDTLINLMEEMLGQPSIQAVAWLLLAAFSQIYNENWEQKAEQKNLKTYSLIRKGSPLKLGPRKVWLLNRSAPLKRIQVQGQLERCYVAISGIRVTPAMAASGI